MMSGTWKKRKIGLGGTFDHLHDGHTSFIDFAAKQGGELILGLTSDKMVASKPFSYSIQPFKVRKKAVLSYCKQKNYKVTIIQLEDPFGPAVTSKELFGLALTPDTLDNGKIINQLRAKLSLRPLETFVAPLKSHQGSVISSRKIREGSIDRTGESYTSIIKNDVKLSPEQRSFFSQVQGEMISTPAATGPKRFVGVVGDESLELFLDHDWKFSVGVYDLKKQRLSVSSPTLQQLKPDLKVTNPPGFITQDLVSGLSTAISSKKKKSLVFVDGEEDLAGVALVLVAPLESYIYYGQPNAGLVEMQVTEQLKNKVRAVLRS